MKKKKRGYFISFIQSLCSRMTETAGLPLLFGSDPGMVADGGAAVRGRSSAAGGRRRRGRRGRRVCVIRPAAVIHCARMLAALCADRDKRPLASRGLIGLFTSYNWEEEAGGFEEVAGPGRGGGGGLYVCLRMRE